VSCPRIPDCPSLPHFPSRTLGIYNINCVIPRHKRTGDAKPGQDTQRSATPLRRANRPLLEDSSRLLLDRWKGDLRKLRGAGREQPAERPAEGVQGDRRRGVDIFFREVQGVWGELSPLWTSGRARPPRLVSLTTRASPRSSRGLPRLVAAWCESTSSTPTTTCSSPQAEPEPRARQSSGGRGPDGAGHDDVGEDTTLARGSCSRAADVSWRSRPPGCGRVVITQRLQVVDLETAEPIRTDDRSIPSRAGPSGASITMFGRKRCSDQSRSAAHFEHVHTRGREQCTVRSRRTSSRVPPSARLGIIRLEVDRALEGSRP